MKSIEEERRRLDEALRETNFSSKTKGLWAYYRKGDEILNTPISENTTLTYLGRAKKWHVPKNMQKAFAVYTLNQVRNGAITPYYGTTRKTTLLRWKKAVDIVDKIRKNIRR